MADGLARMGVGSLVLIDRDLVEVTNLDRQVLFDEADVSENRPKALAAARRLAGIHSAGRYEPVLVDLDHESIEPVLDGVDLVLDGTDNFSTRFLLNDFCLSRRLPWVHAAVVATSGQVLPIAPGGQPCYRCYLADEPPPGAADTCDVAGVLGPAVGVVASLALVAGLRFLLSDRLGDRPPARLTTVEVWSGRFDSLAVPARKNCPACVSKVYDDLEGRRRPAPARLCGGQAVQVRPRTGCAPDLAALARRLEGVGSVAVRQCGEHLLRFEAEGMTVSLFRDGRAIIHGTDDPSVGRSLYARYVGD